MKGNKKNLEKQKLMGDNNAAQSHKGGDTSAHNDLLISQELRKKAEETLKERDRLEAEIKAREERFYKREIEYRKTINELEQEIKKKGQPRSLDLEQSYQQRKMLEKEIHNNIDNIQLKTSKILVDQEKDIIKFFNNKIFEIKKQFEEERIKKGKKDKDYIEKENQLIKELEWIKNIAQKIDDENHSLMKQYMDLKAQYQTQENDREMLLKELIMKKKKNAILKSQIEQYQKLYNEVSKEVDDHEQSQHLSQTNKSQLKTYSQTNRNMSGTGNQFLNKSQMNDYKQHQKECQDRAQRTLATLYETLKKEQKRIQKLKALYVKEIESQSELETIIQSCVDELKVEVDFENQNKSQNYGFKKNNNKSNQYNKEFREKLIDQLLNNEKILSLVYDKTFYPEIKNQDDSASEQFKPSEEQQFDPDFDF